jgi:hypothetical protein
MDEDTTGPMPSRADYGRQAWDDTVNGVITTMDDEYGETVTIEEVEGYLQEELNIADPYDEDVEFDFEDDGELAEYFLDLDSVTAEGAYLYIFEKPAPGGECAEDGEPVVLISGDVEMDEVAIDPCYSSEEDEEPADDKEFRFVLDVAQAANKQFATYLRGLPDVAGFLAHIAKMIDKITRYKATHRGPAPVPFFPVVLSQPTDWPAFCHAMSGAKRTTLVREPTKVVTVPAPGSRKRGNKPGVPRSWIITKPITTPLKPTTRKGVKWVTAIQRRTMRRWCGEGSRHERAACGRRAARPARARLAPAPGVRGGSRDA